MDSTTPTPGPWRAVWTTGAKQGWAIVPDGYAVAPIAWVGLPNAIPERREESDARLIAAAPDMYEALVQVQKYLDEAREAVGSDLDQLADQVADALDMTTRRRADEEESGGQD
jgi:hypothetical protein